MTPSLSPETVPLLGPASASPEPHKHSNGAISTSIVSSLCVSHFLSAWNSRIFEFGSVLFLVSIWPNSLTLVSVYALVRAAAAILLSPAVGRFIDRGNRLFVVQVSIVGQRVAVALSCGLLLVLERHADPTSVLFLTIFGGVVFLGGAEKLCAILNSVSVTRDWVVEMTQNDVSCRTHLNAQIRRIDLGCKLFGPLLIASIDEYSTVVAIWFTLASTLASALLEIFCIETVYRRVPSLHKKRIKADPTPTSAAQHEVGSQPSAFKSPSWCTYVHHLLPWRSLALYTQHTAFLPSFSYAFLQFTVLSFSGRMVAFLLALGYSSFSVSIARMISTLAELSATWISPVAIKRLGNVRTAGISVTWQTACLTVGIVYFFFGSQFAVVGLVVGVILSRIGLWVFDLSVHNIIQNIEKVVEDDDRGAFSTAEASVHNLFEMFSYITTIVFAKPEEFKWPMLMTIGSMYCACITYAMFAMTTTAQCTMTTNAQCTSS
ncbi:hypothetical protein S40288_07727 [Stachybotrys chartarum IBT 40288]|nr:hypothetical protein S40288_07727 [Stachybotrys chartarum IBT 40288]